MTIDGSAILDYPAVIRGMRRIYSTDEVSDVVTTAPPLPPRSSVHVRPRDEPPFSVRLELDGSGCTIDGDARQNLRSAAALRAEIPIDAPRIVAIDLQTEEYTDLRPGVTADELESNWRPLAELDDAWGSDERRGRDQVHPGISAP